MRDEKDPGTLEMALPKKAGRPPKYSFGAMSPAMRARIYRQNKKIKGAPVSPKACTDKQLLENIAQCITMGDDGEGDMRAYVSCYAAELMRRYPGNPEALM